ncbi:MAG TPA: DUF2239 family protein [Spirochaetales bacterium]|nr:DUF2239 family protein [Spirochaetales bacterium]
MNEEKRYTVFCAVDRIAQGNLASVLAVLNARSAVKPAVLVFDDDSGKQVDFDTSGSLEAVLARYACAEQEKKGPGRPKLGVKGMEVTLLPRHWEWLERQSQGISATLRRLVDMARAAETDQDRQRVRVDAAYRFINAIAGNLAGFEEACRALYRFDGQGFASIVSAWPRDIAAHAMELAGWGKDR